MRLGLISDVHAAVAPVKEAIGIFKNKNVDTIYCLGDVAGYGFELLETIEVLKQHKIPCLYGNHEAWYQALDSSEREQEADSFFNQCQQTFELKHSDKNVLMIHIAPEGMDQKGIKLLDQNGEYIDQKVNAWKEQLIDFDYDVLIVGHTHQVYATQIADVFVINPGSSIYNHSCAILDLDTLSVDWISLSGKQISTVWNWSLLRR